MTITHASLFSGIGAPELAATWMGWQNLFNCEIDPFCRQILNYWFPQTTSYEDITKTDFKSWRGRVTVLTGGFPCQPFSHAGQRRGAEDNRYLWPQMFRVVREIQPAYVVAENVTGIASMVKPGSTAKVATQTDLFGQDNDICQTHQQFVLDSVCSDLESEGYSVQAVVIPACAVGAPHKRDRVWVIARCADAQNTLRLRCKGQSATPSAQDLQHRDAGTGDSKRHRGKTRTAADTADTGAKDMRTGQINPDSLAGPHAYADGNGGVPPRKGADGKGEGIDKLPLTDRQGERYASQWDSRLLRLSRAAAYTDGRRGLQVCDNIQAGVTDGGVADGTGHEWDAADSCGTQLEGTHKSRYRQAYERMQVRGDIAGHSALADETKYPPQECWASFPTQSPVCRGNDGLPFDVDYLALPFPQWRANSIKAYGNSMVPQVVFEIFRAIQQDICLVCGCATATSNNP